MTDKTIAFSLLDPAPIPEASLQRGKHSSHSLDPPVWLKSAAIIATGWQNTTI